MAAIVTKYSIFCASESYYFDLKFHPVCTCIIYTDDSTGGSPVNTEHQQYHQKNLIVCNATSPWPLDETVWSDIAARRTCLTIDTMDGYQSTYQITPSLNDDDVLNDNAATCG